MESLSSGISARLEFYPPIKQRESTIEIMRIGLDLAKNVFEFFGVDKQEKDQLRKVLKRNKVLEFFSQLESAYQRKKITHLQP